MRLLFNNDRGFINVRRLATFCGQLKADCSVRLRDSESEAVDDDLIEKLRKAPCVADGFLAPRQRFNAVEIPYCAWLKRYCDYLKRIPSHWASEQKLEQFLTTLAKEDVAASTQN